MSAEGPPVPTHRQVCNDCDNDERVNIVSKSLKEKKDKKVLW